MQLHKRFSSLLLALLLPVLTPALSGAQQSNINMPASLPRDQVVANVFYPDWISGYPTTAVAPNSNSGSGYIGRPVLNVNVAAGQRVVEVALHVGQRQAVRLDAGRRHRGEVDRVRRPQSQRAAWRCAAAVASHDRRAATDDVVGLRGAGVRATGCDVDALGEHVLADRGVVLLDLSGGCCRGTDYR